MKKIILSLSVLICSFALSAQNGENLQSPNKQLSKVFVSDYTQTDNFQQNNIEKIRDSTFTAKYYFGLTPHYMLRGGFRPVFELPRKNYKQHLQVAPVIFYVTKDKTENSGIMNDDDYSKIVGAGLDFNVKYYPGGSNKLVNTYVAYGVDYAFIEIQSIEESWQNVTVNGQTQLEAVEVTAKQKVNRAGASAMFGLHFNTTSNLYIDAYIGTGIRFNTIKLSPEDITVKFNDRNWEYAYSGTIMRLGVTLGVRIE